MLDYRDNFDKMRGIFGCVVFRGGVFEFRFKIREFVVIVKLVTNLGRFELNSSD